jgi:hypothetical protein
MSKEIPAIIASRFKKAIAFFLVATMVTGCLLIAPIASAEDTSASAVPEPRVDVRHQTSGNLDDRTLINDMWTTDISDGDVTILLLARNLTSTTSGDSWVDYQSDINYHVGDNLYIAQITIMQIKFLIDGKQIPSVLNTCKKIGMNTSSIETIDGLPSLYCNITYSEIGLQQSSSMQSTFDLTLSHHIVINMTQTDIKVEARFDLSKTVLINPETAEEYASGTPFAIEIPYSMMLTLPNSHGEPIPPSGHTDTSLEYNLNMSDGTPISVSKLKMDNNFTVVNKTGSYASVGYSNMQYGAQSQVTHGFPNLIYNDTLVVQSDPEITIYHNSLGGVLNFLSNVMVYVIVGAIAVIAVVGAVFVIKRRKKK